MKSAQHNGVTMSEQTPARAGLDRRGLLLRAIALVGGAGALGVLQGCGDGGRFFTDQRMTLVDAVANVLIPDTDTPGARAAGVPAFIESMMVNWASRDTRDKVVSVLNAIDDRARDQHQARFVELDDAQKLAFMRDFDAEALSEEGNPYRILKELVLLGYYSSEIGATQELRLEMVPGAYHGDVPFSEVGRAWAL